MALGVVRSAFRRARRHFWGGSLSDAIEESIKLKINGLSKKFDDINRKIEENLKKNLDVPLWDDVSPPLVILRPHKEFIKDVEAIKLATGQHLLEVKEIETYLKSLEKELKGSGSADAREAKKLLAKVVELRKHAESADQSAKKALGIARDYGQRSQVASIVALGEAKDDIAKAQSIMSQISKDPALKDAILAGATAGYSRGTLEVVTDGVLDAIDYGLETADAVECVSTFGVSCVVDAGLEYALDKAIEVSAPVVEPVVGQVIEWGGQGVATVAAGAGAVADEAGKQLNKRVGTKLEAAFRVPEKATQEIGNRATGGSWWPSFSP
ncbi:MAG: hypothetical protein K1X66_03475 [Verrucomicrobiae bacterium]|nr:hypothetical protein [Verrucomicrobiae bacterium]